MNIWVEEFGDNYQLRNTASYKEVINRKHLWYKILCRDDIRFYSHLRASINSIFEIGAGAGANLLAINDIDPKIKLECSEVNKYARDKLLDNPFISDTYSDTSDVEDMYDLVFTYGVLIHIHPKDLKSCMIKMYNLSNRYILFCEYFRPEATPLLYRGKQGELWGNDFGKVFIKMYGKKVKCIDNGFLWKETTGLDNITYWLFEKVSC